MDFVGELKTELESLEYTREIIIRNPVFINEEINDLEKEIRKLKTIMECMEKK